LKTLAAAAAGAAAPASLRALVPQQVPVPATRRVHSAVRNLYANQVGYLTHQRKVATIVVEEPRDQGADTQGANAMAAFPDPCVFEVFAAGSSTPVLTGNLSRPKFDPLSGDHVAQADFSAIVAPGTYRVRVMGVEGDPVTIGGEAYAEPLWLAMRAYYGQRCGCSVDLGGGYKHGRCHTDGSFGASSGRAGALKNAGGWHDAGDYGRYVVNSGITCGTLLWAWEFYPEAVKVLGLEIPESGKAIPDYLAEIKWNLDWMLTMQGADGGVWHKQTSDHFCAFIMPEKDELPSHVIGTGEPPYKSTAATGDLASVMAIAARCFQPYDPKFAAHCLSAARQAFTWAQAHPSVVFKNPVGITTGEYGDPHCADEIVWAAAELFRTTGEAAYETYVLGALESHPVVKIEAPSWGNVVSMALWTYALATAEKPNATTKAIHAATKEAAANLVKRATDNGYGHTLSSENYHWGSNSEAGNQSLLLLMANHFERDQAVFEAALGNLHYLLGRNCFGTSWVTHVGVRPFLHPHHRPSVADGIAEPWPGMLSGGPNAHGGDAVADRLPESAPMRMWIDDDRAYSLNEIAINWNAPLVFLLAAANAPVATGMGDVR
jgi:endoglucanase